jgi:hypothetical protein
VIPQLLARRDKNRRRRRVGVGPFAPEQIAAVAAGYFWDPAAATGSAGAGFLMPEGNGKTSYDMITPSAPVAPTIATINGQAVISYLNAAQDTCVRTAATVTRGFTGAQMIFGWFDRSLDPGLVIGQWRTNSNFEIALGSTRTDIGVNDGTSSLEYRFSKPVANIVFVEAVFDPSAVNTNRCQLFYDRVQQTPTTAPACGTALQDLASYIHTSAAGGDFTPFNINANFSHGVIGWTNGIPSAAERDLLFLYKPLKLVQADINGTTIPAVKAWLQNTATSGSVASVTDLLSVNPATQSTGAKQPTATTLNGFPALTFDSADDMLSWPIIPALNGSVTFGLAGWMKLATVTGGTRRLFSANGSTGASDARFEILLSTTALLVDVYTSTFTSRRGQNDTLLQSTTPFFLSVEYDGGQAAEADRLTVWVNNVKQTLVFSNASGTPPGSTMPATLTQITGTAGLCGLTSSSFFNGTLGRNIYALGGAGGIPGGGLLTSAQRATLMNFEPAA